jgi:hypothetical protein
MDPATLKKNFEEQIATTDKADYGTRRKPQKAKEYKTQTTRWSRNSRTSRTRNRRSRRAPTECRMIPDPFLLNM